MLWWRWSQVGRLRLLVTAEAKRAEHAALLSPSALPAEAATPPAPPAPLAGGSGATAALAKPAASPAPEVPLLATALAAADDPADPRRAMAAADVGAAYAVKKRTQPHAACHIARFLCFFK